MMSEIWKMFWLKAYHHILRDVAETGLREHFGRQARIDFPCSFIRQRYQVSVKRGVVSNGQQKPVELVKSLLIVRQLPRNYM
jgi:hypothetical protein